MCKYYCMGALYASWWKVGRKKQNKWQQYNNECDVLKKSWKQKPYTAAYTYLTNYPSKISKIWLINLIYKWEQHKQHFLCAPKHGPVNIGYPARTTVPHVWADSGCSLLTGATDGNHIYPTPPLGYDMTLGQFFKRSLTGLNSEFSFS